VDVSEPSAISFSCSGCGASAAVSAERAGERGRCWRCGAIMIVPESASGYALAETPVPPLAVAAPLPIAPKPRRGPSVRRIVSGWVHASARERSALEGESIALILLSLADLMVTYHLLKTGPSFYESNPVAQFFFARWNIAGMAVFKFSVVGFVVVAGEIVERHRPGLGRFVVLLGCLASGAVVCYGLKLAFGELAG
jgi:hypothetical protein